MVPVVLRFLNYNNSWRQIKTFFPIKNHINKSIIIFNLKKQNKTEQKPSSFSQRLLLFHNYNNLLLYICNVYDGLFVWPIAMFSSSMSMSLANNKTNKSIWNWTNPFNFHCVMVVKLANMVLAIKGWVEVIIITNLKFVFRFQYAFSPLQLHVAKYHHDNVSPCSTKSTVVFINILIIIYIYMFGLAIASIKVEVHKS